MPLFGRHSTDTTSSASASPPRNHPEPVAAERSTTRSSGLFHRTHSPSNASASSGSVRHSHSVLSRGRFGGHHEDPSIVAAREQVVAAEASEREADKALMASRRAVVEARDHVKRLEKEAAEEARLARIKQDQAKSISKRAKPLGRYM